MLPHSTDSHSSSSAAYTPSPLIEEYKFALQHILQQYLQSQPFTPISFDNVSSSASSVLSNTASSPSPSLLTDGNVDLQTIIGSNVGSCSLSFSRITLTTNQKTSASLNEETMLEYLKNHHEENIKSTLNEDVVFEHDEKSVCLRRRKLTLIESGADTNQAKTTEIFMFMVNESDPKEFSFHSLGSSSLSKKNEKLIIKSKETVHSQTCLCNKGRIVMWKRDKKDRSHLDLFISVDTYPVYADKPKRSMETEENAPKKRKVKSGDDNSDNPIEWSKERLIENLHLLSRELQNANQMIANLCLLIIEKDRGIVLNEPVDENNSLQIENDQIEILGDIKEAVSEQLESSSDVLSFLGGFNSDEYNYDLS